MKHIALATGAKLPTLNEDDLLLVPPLRELGVTAVPAVWDSPDVCWEEFQGVVVRSCWDYHHRLEEFLAWVVRLERAGIPLWNPPAVLRWNSHKGYLRDLAARGVPVVPTRWLGRGEPVDLPMLLEDAGWRDAVIKPAVSASASGTWRTSTEAAAGDQARLGELLRAGDVMVQPFVSEVRDRGEWSILFLGGQLSHAVLKRPAEGDYRVQWEFGGSAVTMAPPPTLVADAEAVMAAVPGDPVYARVDGVEHHGARGRNRPAQTGRAPFGRDLRGLLRGQQSGGGAERNFPQPAPSLQVDGDERAEGRRGARQSTWTQKDAPPHHVGRPLHAVVLVVAAEALIVGHGTRVVEAVTRDQLHHGRDPVDGHHGDLPHGVHGDATPVRAADVRRHHEGAPYARRREHALVAESVDCRMTGGAVRVARAPDAVDRETMRAERRRHRGERLAARRLLAGDVARGDRSLLRREDRLTRLAIQHEQHAGLGRLDHGWE